VSGGVNPPTHDFRLKFWLSVQTRAPTVFYSFFGKALLVPIKLEAGWAPEQLWTFFGVLEPLSRFIGRPQISPKSICTL